MRLRQFLFLFLTLFLLAFPALAQQEARTAVIVGNSSYSFAPLVNPKNDAEDIAEALTGAGFQVNLLLDATQDEIMEAVVGLSDILEEKGGVGLFFFAGHGVQVEGENYLLPIGEAPGDAAQLKAETVSAAEVVERMSAAGNDLNIVILDACRDNPLTGAVSGLSRIDSSAKLFISYSTSPGAVALDGEGRNSPYTKHLTLSLATPGLNLEETFKETLKGVYQETGGKQTPWLSSTFFGEFVFKDGPAGEAKADQQSGVQSSQGGKRTAQLRLPDAAELAGPRLTGIYRAQGTNPDGSRYRGMAAVTEADGRYGVTWWIGKGVFQGSGELAGRMLVVDWNDRHPVVYEFAPDGVLDGEWADGTATDVLKPFGLTAGSAPAAGRYNVDGRNADGSRYRGTVDIDGDGRDYEFRWKIGSSAYSGRGALTDGLLVVDWGSSQPIVYAVREDGSLAGLWDNGRASEVLTPR